MKNYKKNLKPLVLLLGFAMMMPFSAQAQTKSMYHEGSLMDDPMSKNFQNGLMGNRSGGLDVAQWTFANDYFGQETPVGSGIAILIVAGAGYVLTRRRKEERQ